jgi:erythromycin esterase-like protein
MAEPVVAAEPIAGGPVPTPTVNAEENTKPRAAGDPQATQEQGDPETDEQRRKSGYQRQKDARLRAEAEVDFLRGQLARRDAPKPEVKAEDVKPKKEDFSDLETYLDARDAWVERNAERKAKEVYESTKKAETEQAQKQKVEDVFKAQVNTAREEIDDYDEVAFAKFPVTDVMADAIRESELGARVLYELGKNQQEAARIAQLGPLAQAREIGKIEARIAQEKSKPAEEAEQPAPVSKAPPPPTPVRKAAGVNAPDIHDPNLPFKTFTKLREEQVAKRQGK